MCLIVSINITLLRICKNLIVALKMAILKLIQTHNLYRYTKTMGQVSKEKKKNVFTHCKVEK